MARQQLKIVYLNYLYDPHDSSVGAAVHVREFVRAAEETGAQVKSFDMNKFTLNGGAQPSPTRSWLKKKLSRYLNEPNALLSNIGYFFRELKIVARENPDALLVRYNLLNVSAALIARLKRIPMILEVNAPMALENRKFNRRVWHLPWIPEWIERINLRLAERVITVSKILKDHFVQAGVNPRKIHVVPNGVNVEAFHPHVDGRVLRQQLGFEDAVVIGFVGSFHYWHGVEQLEDFVKHLAQKYQSVRFLFVGSGPLKDECEAAMKQNGLQARVHFAGYVPYEQVPQYLAAMDIALAPYPQMDLFYFSPLKLFEYMAAGKAVVASRVGQIAELVEDGENGLLFAPGNFEELLAKTSQLVEESDLRARLARNARATILKQYTWQKNAEQILNIINSSLNGKH